MFPCTGFGTTGQGGDGLAAGAATGLADGRGGDGLAAGAATGLGDGRGGDGLAAGAAIGLRLRGMCGSLSIFLSLSIELALKPLCTALLFREHFGFLFLLDLHCMFTLLERAPAGTTWLAGINLGCNGLGVGHAAGGLATGGLAAGDHGRMHRTTGSLGPGLALEASGIAFCGLAAGSLEAGGLEAGGLAAGGLAAGLEAGGLAAGGLAARGLAARGLAVGAVAVGTDAAGGADTFGHACWC
jgi:hypothetical protein